MTEDKIYDSPIITSEQARALASLIHAFRPSWAVTAILHALSDARHRGTAMEVIEAALAATRSRDVHTPAVIPMDGLHWVVGTPLPVERARPRCTVPGHEHNVVGPDGLCKDCRAEHLGTDQPAEPDWTPPTSRPVQIPPEAAAILTRLKTKHTKEASA